MEGQGWDQAQCIHWTVVGERGDRRRKPSPGHGFGALADSEGDVRDTEGRATVRMTRDRECHPVSTVAHVHHRASIPQRLPENERAPRNVCPKLGHVSTTSVLHCSDDTQVAEA